jgi:hypothetical protein
MPAISSISIADGQPTPVTRVFAPLMVDKAGVAIHENRVSGIQIGYDQLTVGLRRATQQVTNNKLSVKLVLPTLEVTSPSTASGIQPAPTLAYACTAFVEFVLPSRSTAQNREDLVALLRNALVAGGVIATCVENIEAEY